MEASVRAARSWVLVAAALLLPVASAAESSFSLTSADPVELSGALDAQMPAGSLYFQDGHASGAREIAGVTGEITLWTWRVARSTPSALQVSGDARQQIGEATSDPHRVVNATLRFRVDGPFALTVLAGEGGAVGLSGGVDARGLPKTLTRALEESPTPAVSPWPPAEDLLWRYEPGWGYVGNWLTQADGPVFPLPDAPRARFAGPVAFKAEQGRVAFVDADGTPIDLDLAATADHTLPVGETDVMHRLVFHGTVAGADLPAGDAWALAGASPVWRLQGDATWRHATGEVSSQGQVRRFTDENLTLRGAVSIRPEAPHAAAPLPGATRFEGDGAFEARVEGGAAFPAQSSPAVVAVASLGVVLATLALVAWKVLGAFYTRMAPEDALLHPRRRAIYDAALDHPGERLRDLQRRLGMAWGSFSFHVHVLVRGGHLRLRKEGAYRLVIPTASAAAAGAPVIPHPVTRLVYDAIPPDGSSLAFADLRGRLGFSRQRVNHHLAALQARGLVEVRRGPGRARDVARKAEA